MSKPLIYTALFSLSIAAPAMADCDFDKPISECKATITIDSTKGSKKSYSAEVTVKSSSSCSKVEYYLDKTPQTTIIRSSRVEHESIFGTKPIDRSDISIFRCTQYAELDKGKRSSTKQDDEAGWSVTGSWVDDSSVQRLQIREVNGKITGTGTISNQYPGSDGGTFTAVNKLAVSGSRSGEAVTITTKDLEFGSTYTSQYTLVDKNTLRHEGGNWSFTRAD
ncbi:hypothetical protein O9X98_06390 [Agrobacterium salinitolerans]|nr:hypothetical protein [Agrobacterium salinitolerans]